jgi:hypothetical protein
MIPALCYGIYRWLAFERLVPNTFFAKLEPAIGGLGHGVRDIAGWTVGHGAIWLLVVILVILGYRRGSAENRVSEGPSRWLLLPAGWLILEALVVLAAGGDWMGQTRYLGPVVPALCLVAAELWNRDGGGWGRVPTGALIGVVLVVHLGVGWLTRDRIPDYTLEGRTLGLWLRSVASPGEDLAVSAAGAIPYFSELPTYDVLGINDPGVAGRKTRHAGTWAPGHHRYDIEDLVRTQPTWIVWDFSVRLNEHRERKYRGWTGDRETLDYRQALLAHPEFRQLYAVQRNSPPETQGAYTVYRHR